MKKAKGKVKVLLDGQGGDEVFGGYFLGQTYIRSLIKDIQLKKLLNNIKLLKLFLKKDEFLTLIMWLFPNFYNKFIKRYISTHLKIINPDILHTIKKNELSFDGIPPKKFKNYLNNLSYHFIFQMTIPTLLHFEDRSSMAHSIESREPLLDYRLVEFGLNLPPEYLADENITRPFFRDALKDLLPAEIVNRSNKLGFPTPFENWSRTYLKPFILDTLTNNNYLNNYINYKYLQVNLKNHFEMKIDYSWDIWRLLSLNKFLENVAKLFK